MTNSNQDYDKFMKDQCTRIKFLVQQFSGVSDIGIKSRKQVISDLKKIYCKIAKDKTKASLSIIASCLREGYNHASVLHSIKKFDNLYSTKQLLHIDVYKKTVESIDELKELDMIEESTSKLIIEFTTFLEWFRKETGDESPVESSFFVGKYFAITEKN